MFPANEEQKQKDLAWANEYVKRQVWREAKTYRNTAPHEYIVVTPSHSGRADFRHMFDLVMKYGRFEKFYGKTFLYLFLNDGYKYFFGTGDEWNEGYTILNRAKAEITYGKQN